MTSDPIADLSARVAAGDGRAIARAISLVEDDGPAGRELVGRIYARTGRAFLVGVTGAPGTGKSTLVDRLIAEIRRGGAKVGVIAVDPTSPFSGGAVLGDRVRMNAHAADDGVFIRSMATRGHLGGLARATSDAALVLDAAGIEVVIIETVGVGQDEVDIVSTADVSIVLLVPGAGDDLQAIKAGVMEIGDIFVVNKADREGADRVVQGVASNLSLKTYGASEWKPPILKTEATTGGGVEDLWKEIGRFREWASAQRHERRRQRHVSRLREMLAASFLRHVDSVLPPGDVDRLVEEVGDRRRDPYSVVEEIMSRVLPTMKAVLDHIGIAVQDIEKAIAFYGEALGLEVQAPEEVVSRTCQGACGASRWPVAGVARSDRTGLGDCDLYRQAWPRPASRHASCRRPSRGVGASEGSWCAARSTQSRGLVPKALSSRSSIRRRLTASWSN